MTAITTRLAQQAGGVTSPLPLFRPMEIGELLDEASDLYKRNFRLFFGTAALLIVPCNLLSVAVKDNETGQWLVFGLYILVSLVTTSALTRAAMDRLLGRETTIAGAYRRTLVSFLRLLPVSIVYWAAAFLGLFLFVFPGLLVFLWSQLLAPVVVVECRGFGALLRPVRLAAGNVWRLFLLSQGLMLVIVIYLAVLGSLAALVYVTTGVNPILPPEGMDPVVLLTYSGVTVADSLIQSAWLPVWTNAQLLMYIDLRIRREAYDLELLSEAVETRVAGRKASVLSPTGLANG
jgi:hypothetical protein